MKKILILLFLLISCTTVFAEPIKEIVFFGDSISDNGNLYGYLGIIPKSPPYYEGRFSNGPTWAENLGQYYRVKSNINYSIYAVGGATTVLRNPFKGILPLELKEEVYDYLVRSAYTERTNTLFVILIGANDYLGEPSEDVNVLTTEVVDEIASVITTLIDHGAKHFLLLNLPNLSRIPRAIAAPETIERLTKLSQLHNQKLADAIATLKKQYTYTTFITTDIFTLFDDLLSNPAKYNQKYNVTISNTTEACWAGGYTSSTSAAAKKFTPVINVDTLSAELQQAQAKQGKRAATFDTREMASYILKSPELREAYTVSKLQEAGITPCNNPNEHVFWDEIHPTATIHQIIARGVEENLETTGGLQ